MEEHLKELLESTPSSRMKILAAWDGLSIETQIKLLHALANGGRLHLSFHRDIIAKALKSPNEYIRYLVARSPDLAEDSEMLEQVATDESPLVRYAQEEVKRHSVPSIFTLGWPEGFFEFPRAKQLAIAGAQDPPSSSSFAKFLMFAVQANGTPPGELSEVLSEYLNNPEVKRKRLGHEDLWEIVPQMPKGEALKLVMDLSAESGIDMVIPYTVLDWLRGDLLIAFLCRVDVELTEFRREVFLSSEEKYTIAERIAAAGRHFRLFDDEFHRLLKERSPRLEMLCWTEKFFDEALMYLLSMYRCPLPLHNLRLSHLECLKDYFVCQEQVGQGDSEPHRYTRSMFEHKLEQLQEKLPGKLSYQDKEELLRLKIYRLARTVMTWTGNKYAKELRGPLKFLADKIVEGDTWATFMAFNKELTRGVYPVERSYWYYHYLPVLEELGEIDPKVTPGVDNLETLFGIKLARVGISRESKSIATPASEWLDWSARVLRRLFR